MIGGNIIIPMDIKIGEITISMAKNSTNIRNPISKARRKLLFDLEE
jgi:hypothetical protein